MSNTSNSTSTCIVLLVLLYASSRFRHLTHAGNLPMLITVCSTKCSSHSALHRSHATATALAASAETFSDRAATSYGSEGQGLESSECGRVWAISGQGRPGCRKRYANRPQAPGGAATGVRAGAAGATCIPPSMLPGRRRLGPRAYRPAPASPRFEWSAAKGYCLLHIKWLDRMAGRQSSRPDLAVTVVWAGVWVIRRPGPASAHSASLPIT